MIKAIETRYAGCHFRSRLEARWAVFFDHLGVGWEYEPEGYETPDGPYLPDFRLTLTGGEKVWFEVKPPIDRWTSEVEDERWKHVGVIVTYGLPDPRDLDRYGQGGSHENFYTIDLGMWDCSYAFCICPDCGGVGIQFEARSDRMACKTGRCGTCPRHAGNQDRTHTGDDPRIINAYIAARSARFEHGQSGPS